MVAFSLRTIIVASLALTTMVVTSGAIVWSLLFYGITGDYYPDLISDNMMPSRLEWGWVVVTVLGSAGFTALVAMRLSRRLLVPLNSVAVGLRELAQGNFKARAVVADRSMGEATLLVADFNGTARRLESAEADRAFWNAAIAHELRTPLTILRGKLHGLADGVYQPDAACLTSLLAQVEGLNRLVEDLRLLSLQDSHNLRLHCEHLPLAELVDGVAEALGEGLAAAGFQLQVQASPARVHCDRVRMRQALYALLENVRVHADPGPVLVQAACFPDYCQIEVRDAGPGIDEAQVQRLFEPFERGEILGSTRPGGTGLGLPVVRAIARAHGGELSGHRQPTGGSVFKIRWPQ